MTFTISANGYSISLDSKESGADIDFISHAHTDHMGAARSSASVLSSRETSYLIEKTYGIKVNACKDMPEGVKLLDAGHMLGSSQLSVTDNETCSRIVYTGDYLLQRSRVANPIAIEDADTVIIDSTYPDPKIEFEDREEVERSIQLWARTKLKAGTLLFGAYTLGKSQELVAILNEIGIEPIMSKKLAMATDAYNDLGMGLRYQSVYSEDFNRSLISENEVGIVESNSLEKVATMLSGLNGRRVYTAVATGFAAIFKFNTDVQFQLSDHADFRQCMEYIERSKAKRVFTRGGGAKALAATLRRRGYEAEVYGASTALSSNLVRTDASKASGGD
ncbi:mRNA 3'-end processing factor [mine drainage metagenome]|uniref:mRNA 3'-end processing factor n=1 Tax=mine drainage metagenome TaxID=410659 RepID=T1AVG8_9ZZZZ